jgi:hypothetical protein
MVKEQPSCTEFFYCTTTTLSLRSWNSKTRWVCLIITTHNNNNNNNNNNNAHTNTSIITAISTITTTTRPLLLLLLLLLDLLWTQIRFMVLCMGVGWGLGIAWLPVMLVSKRNILNGYTCIIIIIIISNKIITITGTILMKNEYSAPALHTPLNHFHPISFHITYFSNL